MLEWRTDKLTTLVNIGMATPPPFSPSSYNLFFISPLKDIRTPSARREGTRLTYLCTFPFLLLKITLSASSVSDKCNIVIYCISFTFSSVYWLSHLPKEVGGQNADPPSPSPRLAKFQRLVHICSADANSKITSLIAGLQPIVRSTLNMQYQYQ